ncbi:MAG: helix-turn-helix domain-containing protein [Candidatus Eiseniibacteriota bacterium]
MVTQAQGLLATDRVWIWVRRSDGRFEGPYPKLRGMRRVRTQKDDPKREWLQVDGDPCQCVDLVFGGELQGVLAVAGPTPPPTAALDWFCEFAAGVIGNHRAFDLLRGREAALEAMLATVRDLAAEHHTQTVLEGIVARARRLLRSDSAYITLIEGTATRVRITLGTRTEEFERVVLGPGQGLGGLVAAQLASYYTPDYLTDGRFKHTSEIDRAVRGEGLRSILGVPMMVTSELLGVLFVGNRRSRTAFTERHVEVLQGLADHAALALQNAQLLEAAQAAADRFQRLHATANAQNDALRRASQMHERLTELVLGDHGLDEMALALADFLGCAIEVTDVDGGVLAGSGAAGSDSSPPVPAQLLARASVAARTSWVGDEGPVTIPIVGGGEVVGILLLHGRPNEHLIQAGEQAARALALVIIKKRAVFDAHQRLSGEFFDELLLAHAPAEYLIERGRRFGIDIRAPHRLVVTEPEPNGGRPRSGSDIASATRSIAELSHRGRLVYVIPAPPGADPSDRVATEVAERLRRGGWGTCRVALSATCLSIEDYARRYKEAITCLEVSPLAGDDAPVVTPQSLGAYYLFIDSRREPRVHDFVSRTLGKVCEYDDRGGSLVETLEKFFAAGGNVSRAASTLYIHPNTLYLRLHRISVLTGLNPQDGNDGFELQLAMRLRGTLRASAVVGDAPVGPPRR